jgi:hypothetical protein
MAEPILEPVPDDLFQALKVLESESILSDHFYAIRESEGEGWHGPRMNAWGDACNVIQFYLDHQPTSDDEDT